MLPRLYRLSEACEFLRCSRGTLYRLIREGSLRTVMIGGQRFIPEDALEELLERGAEKAAEIVVRAQ